MTDDDLEDEELTDEEVNELYREGYQVADTVLTAIDNEDFSCHAEIIGLLMAAISVQAEATKRLSDEMLERFGESDAVECIAATVSSVVSDEIREWVRRELEKC